MSDFALPADFHANSKIVEVELDKVKIDRTYQREPSQQLVDQIAANWDEVASELVLISDRGFRPESSDVEGGLWLVNGQHRSLAARKRGHTKIWARVVDLSMSPDPAPIEAALRLKLNVKLGDRPLERFKAQVRAGDPDSLAIVKILERFGTEVNVQTNMEHGINAISMVESIYSADEGALLTETLELIRDAFNGLNGRKVSAAPLKGFAWFIKQHGMESDRTRLVNLLQNLSIEALHRRAITMQSVMGGSLWMNYYRATVEIYNEKLHEKSKLEFKMRGVNQFAVRSKGAVGAAWSGGGGYGNNNRPA